MNPITLDSGPQGNGPISALGRAAKGTAKRAVKRWVWSFLGPVIVPVIAPALLVVAGGLAVLLALNMIVNAGAVPEMRQGKERYEAIAASADPEGLETGQHLDWGILAAAEFVTGRSGQTQGLAQRLAPQVTRSEYAATVSRVAPDGTKSVETVSFYLVSRVTTYNSVYAYAYDFVEWEDEVVPEKREVSRVLDRSRLNDALTWLTGAQVDGFAAQLVEQAALSYDTGKAGEAWLAAFGALEGEAVQWPVAGRVTGGFGPRIQPVTGAYEFHPGVDIAVEAGTPVLAVADGTVESAGWDAGYGLCVVVRHAGGYETVYGHASRVLVGAGQAVTKRQVITLSGDTGSSTGPHLHFELRRGGEAVDPSSWME